jgi:hypothetical protein
MPWFIDAAEKEMSPITIGPFTKQKRAIKVMTALCNALPYVSEPYEREAPDKPVMDGIYERIPEPEDEPPEE